MAGPPPLLVARGQERASRSAARRTATRPAASALRAAQRSVEQQSTRILTVRRAEQSHRVLVSRFAAQRRAAAHRLVEARRAAAARPAARQTARAATRHGFQRAAGARVATRHRSARRGNPGRAARGMSAVVAYARSQVGKNYASGGGGSAFVRLLRIHQARVRAGRAATAAFLGGPGRAGADCFPCLGAARRPGGRPRARRHLHGRRNDDRRGQLRVPEWSIAGSTRGCTSSASKWIRARAGPGARILHMIAEHWPLFGLRLHTPRLELRLPDLDDLAQLAEVAAAGVHDPGRQPFAVPWTEGTPDRGRPQHAAVALVQWGRWTPADWSLQPGDAGRGPGHRHPGDRREAVRDAARGRHRLVARAGAGTGRATARRCGRRSSSWPSPGSGAEYATSEAFADNAASYGVSRALGYADNGIARHVVRGRAIEGRRLRLDRAAWESARTVDVKISGLEPCLPMFGLETPRASGG